MYANEKGISDKSEFYIYHANDLASRIYFCAQGIGDFYYNAGYQLRRNRCSSYLLFYMYSGRCRVNSDGKTRETEAGYFTLMDVHCHHEFTFTEDSHVLWLYFDGPLGETYYDIISQADADTVKNTKELNLLPFMQNLFQDFRLHRVIRDAEVSGGITEALQTFLQSPVTSSNRLQHQISVENACSYINDNFSRSLTLEELSSNAGMSPYHFTRIFTEQTGSTPHQYVIAVRVNAAKYFLGRADCPPIKEIAFDCGFNSESSFCSVFRKWTGNTPSEFRASIQADNVR